MRPIAINQRALRGAKGELDSAREDLRSALGDIDHPADDFPWRDLVVEGVRSLVDDAEQIATRCRTIAQAIDDSLVDFDELDSMVEQAAHVALQARPGEAVVTKVAVDRIETQQDGLRFGDPIGCHYHWTDPREVDSYGDSVRHLGRQGRARRRRVRAHRLDLRGRLRRRGRRHAARARRAPSRGVGDRPRQPARPRSRHQRLLRRAAAPSRGSRAAARLRRVAGPRGARQPHLAARRDHPRRRPAEGDRRLGARLEVLPGVLRHQDRAA